MSRDKHKPLRFGQTLRPRPRPKVEPPAIPLPKPTPGAPLKGGIGDGVASEKRGLFG